MGTIKNNIFLNTWNYYKTSCNNDNNILLDCRIDAPVLVLPLDIYNPDTIVLIFDLGTYYIYSPNIIPKIISNYFHYDNNEETKNQKKEDNVVVESWIVDCEQITIFLGFLFLHNYSNEN